MSPHEGGLHAEDLYFRYPDARVPAVDGLSVQVEPGGFTAVLGPNGSGKSTLLKLLVGALVPDRGRVFLGGRPLRSWSGGDRARCIGVVPQAEPDPFPVTVRELVFMGRYPHMGAWKEPGLADHAVVERAMARCAVKALADRDVSTLSGGESQRARVARALAQAPELLLLDEPTAGLDLQYRMELFQLLTSLCSEGLGVLLVTHDLNLAARFAHQILLLDGGRQVAQGPPEVVIRRSLLEEVYEWPLRIVGHPGPGPDTRAPQAVPLSREAP